MARCFPKYRQDESKNDAEAAALQWALQHSATLGFLLSNFLASS